MEHLINTPINADCFDIFPQIEDKSIDMIFCDLPYGTTQNKWDSIINLADLWKQYERIIKDSGAIVLTAQTPFDKVLGVSNLRLLKYEWIWYKSKATGHLNSKKMPMKAHENVLVFYKKPPVYNPKKTKGLPYKGAGGSSKKDNYGDFKAIREGSIDGSRYPLSIQVFNHETKPIHSTQKPVPMAEYFIETYSNEGDLILDNCAGSFTTAVACENTGRRWICIEKDEEIFLKGKQRVLNHGT